MNLIHSTIINLHSEAMASHIFKVLRKFMEQNYNYLPKDLINQLMDLQENYLIDYNNIRQYPLTRKYDYDFLGYIQSNKNLMTSSILEFDFPEDKSMSLQQFCEQIFFARRRNFGKAWVTQKQKSKKLLMAM